MSELKHKIHLQKRSKIPWYVYGLILLFIFLFVNNYIVISRNEIPFAGDAFNRYQQSVKLFHVVSNIWSKASFFHFIHSDFCNEHYPPLFPFASLPLYAIFGVSRDVACMTNVFFLIILIWSIFLIGREFSNEYGGLLAAFILTTYPNVFGMSRWYMTDFASLAMVSLTILFLIRSDNFLNRKYSILFGLAAAGAVLVRLASIYFFIGPVFFCLFQLQPWRIKESEYFSKVTTAIFNFVLSFFILLALFFPWLYLTKAQVFKHYESWNMLIPTLSRLPGGLKWHFIRSFLNVQLHWFYAFIFFFSAVLLIWKKPKELTFLFLWFIVPLLIISSLTPPGSCERFTLPGLGAVALISALGIFNIPVPKIRVPFTIFVCLIGLVQYFLISYSPLAVKIYPKMKIPRDIKELVQTGDEINMSHVGLLQAKKCNWEIDRIISIIMKDNAGCLSKKVLIIYSSWSLLGSLGEQIMSRRLPITLYWSWNLKIIDDPQRGTIVRSKLGYCKQSLWHRIYSREDIKKITSIILRSNYILTYDKRLIPEGAFPSDSLSDRVFKIFKENRDNFKEIEKLPMPDGYILHVYKNRLQD